MEPSQLTRDAERDIPHGEPPGADPDSVKLRISYSNLVQRIYRRIALTPGPCHVARKIFLRSLGAHIGRGTAIPPCSMPWPHQVWLGDHCQLEPGIYFKFDWYWKTGPNILIADRVFIGRNVEFNIQGRIEIGNDCLIASGCVFIDHDHGMNLRQPMRNQRQENHPIRIGPNVWIGASAVILKGVEISEGAVVGAGSIVTKSIPSNEVWCGNPARKMGLRH